MIGPERPGEAEVVAPLPPVPPLAQPINRRDRRDRRDPLTSDRRDRLYSANVLSLVFEEEGSLDAADANPSHPVPLVPPVPPAGGDFLGWGTL